MPIRRYVEKGVVFTPQALSAMSKALEATTEILGVEGDEAKRQAVARFIVRLAREDASTLALFGSGWQAGSQLPAMCAVRNLKTVKVYSPTASNREAFVKEMQQKVSAEVRAVDNPDDAVKNADIIATTTNSLTRVASPEWVRPGIHLTCVRVPELVPPKHP